MNKPQEAEEVYRRAIDLRREAHQIDPGDNRARTALASILLRDGGLLIDLNRLPDAIKILQEASGLWGTDKSQRAEYGEIEFRLGEAFERMRNGRKAFRPPSDGAQSLFEAARSRGAYDAESPSHVRFKLIARLGLADLPSLLKVRRLFAANDLQGTAVQQTK